MLYYFIFIGLMIFIFWLSIYMRRKIFITNKDEQINHYFILVKNRESEIEGIIRSINYKSTSSGKLKKISVFDYGSTDDTIMIFEKMLYPNKKIDYLYKNQTDSGSLFQTKLAESKKQGEKQIVIDIISKKN